jgi:threonine dehydratase
VASAVSEVASVVDEFVTVDDGAILDAMALLLGRAGIVAEPSGAAGIAAILRNRRLFEKRTVAVIITGSNVRPDLLAEAARRNVALSAPSRPGRFTSSGLRFP